MGMAPVPYGPARALPFFGRDGWGRPRRITGIDPNHPFAGNIRFAAFASGAALIDASRGQAATASASVAYGTAPFLGQNVTSASNSTLSFANRASVVDKAITLAAIVACASTANCLGVATEDVSNSGGWALTLQNLAPVLAEWGVNYAPAGPALTSGQPYFIAVSTTSTLGTATYVVRNLATGKITVSTVNTSGYFTTPAAPGGNPGINFDDNLDTNIAMAYAAGQYHPPSDLFAWAMDMWGLFLQPNNFLLGPYKPLSASASALALSARASAMGFGRGAAAGAVPLLGQSAATAASRARPSGAAVLGARGTSAASAGTKISGIVSLAGRAAHAGAARGAPIGVISLMARAAAAAMARAGAAFSAALSARAASAAQGRSPAPSLLLWLRARAQALSWMGARGRVRNPLIVNPRYVAASRAANFTASARAFFTVASPQPNWTVSDMQATRDFSPALAGSIEGEVACFDFATRVPSGVTIAAIASVTASLHSGADPSPQNIVSGTAQIVASPSSGLAAQAVAQTIEGGIGGTVYLLVCLVQCSDGVPRSLEAHAPFYVPG